jgi:hypothetical protein
VLLALNIVVQFLISSIPPHRSYQVCLHKEGLRNTPIYLTIQYVSLKRVCVCVCVRVCNGRQALRLVHENCVTESHRIFFLFEGALEGQLIGFCVRYSIRVCIVIHELVLSSPRRGSEVILIHRRRLRVIIANN